MMRPWLRLSGGSLSMELLKARLGGTLVWWVATSPWWNWVGCNVPSNASHSVIQWNYLEGKTTQDFIWECKAASALNQPEATALSSAPQERIQVPTEMKGHLWHCLEGQQERGERKRGAVRAENSIRPRNGCSHGILSLLPCVLPVRHHQRAQADRARLSPHPSRPSPRVQGYSRFAEGCKSGCPYTAGQAVPWTHRDECFWEPTKETFQVHASEGGEVCGWPLNCPQTLLLQSFHDH